MITSQRIADLLNEMLGMDKEATTDLIFASAPANKPFVEHPHIVCTHVMLHGGLERVRWLGVLQAIGAMDGHNISAHIDEAGRILRFEAVTHEELKCRQDAHRRGACT